MKIFIALLYSVTSLLVDHSSHTQIQWTAEEVQQPYREYDINPIQIFGTKQFTKIYVNGYGTVSFDQYQLGIVDSQTFTDADLHKIIIAPWWAAVANPVVYVSENGETVASDAAAVNNWIQTNMGKSWFSATTIFTVTWIDQTTTANSNDPKSFQVVIASNGYFTYAIFSYDNSVPTWTADDDGMTPISGLIAHHRRQDLCFKNVPTSQKDVTVGSETGWNLYDHLDCTNNESFTECGDMKAADQGASLDAMSLQYSYTLHYESTSGSNLDVFNWRFYAYVTCNSGFQVDASGNNRYKRECIYDPDFYETDWISPTDPTTGGALQCREMIIQNVQINIFSIVIQQFPAGYLWMLSIDPNGLSAIDQMIWMIMFQQIFISILFETYNVQISINIIAVVTNGVQGRRRRNINNILNSLVANGLVAPNTLGNIADLEQYLTQQATDANAINANTQLVQNVDFAVGFENTQTDAPTVEQSLLTVLTNIQNNVATLPTDIANQIPIQIQELIDSTSCLGHGTISGNNPHWIRPDTCCANRPYNRNYVGCCTLTNGHKRIFDIGTDLCCHGVIQVNAVLTNQACL